MPVVSMTKVNQFSTGIPTVKEDINNKTLWKIGFDFLQHLHGQNHFALERNLSLGLMVQSSYSFGLEINSPVDRDGTIPILEMEGDKRNSMGISSSFFGIKMPIYERKVFALFGLLA